MDGGSFTRMGLIVKVPGKLGSPSVDMEGRLLKWSSMIRSRRITGLAVMVLVRDRRRGMKAVIRILKIVEWI